MILFKLSISVRKICLFFQESFTSKYYQLSWTEVDNNITLLTLLI